MSHRFTPAKQAKLDQLNLPDNLDSNAIDDALIIVDDGSGGKIWGIAPAPAGPVATLESIQDVTVSAPEYGHALKYHDGVARRHVLETDTGAFLDIEASSGGVAGNAIAKGASVLYLCIVVYLFVFVVFLCVLLFYGFIMNLKNDSMKCHIIIDPIMHLPCLPGTSWTAMNKFELFVSLEGAGHMLAPLGPV